MTPWYVELAVAAVRSLIRVVRRPAPPPAAPASPRTHADVIHIQSQIRRATRPPEP